MALLMILSYSTTYGLSGNLSGLNFILAEGRLIGQATAPLVGSAFLVLLGLMLAQTQLGVLDSTSRIMSENAALLKLQNNPDKQLNLSKIYYRFLWGQIVFGISLFLLNFYEPKQLIVAGAIVNALAMFVHIALVNIGNWKTLPPATQPGWPRRIIILVIFLLFAAFGFITLKSYL